MRKHLPLVLLFLFALPACGSSMTAYQRANEIADTAAPALEQALLLAKQAGVLPGAEAAIVAADELLNAWYAQDAGRFNDAVPCVAAALRMVSTSASLGQNEALAIRLEQVSNALQALDHGAVCKPRGSASHSGAGPQVLPQGSTLDSGTNAGTDASAWLDRSRVWTSDEPERLSVASARYRSRAQARLDRAFLYRADGNIQAPAKCRAVFCLASHGDPVWSA